MSLIDKLVLSVKNFHRGRWVRPSKVRHLAIQTEELMRLATLEARAYTDQALSSQVSQGVVTYEVLEQRALVGVQESKAYADGAVSGISSSLGAVACALVELRERVDELSPATASHSPPAGAGLESKLGELRDRLDRLHPQLVGDQGLGQGGEAVAEAKATLNQLTSQIAQLRLVVDKLDAEVTRLGTDEIEVATSESGADPS